MQHWRAQVRTRADLEPVGQETPLRGGRAMGRRTGEAGLVVGSFSVLSVQSTLYRGHSILLAAPASCPGNCVLAARVYDLRPLALSAVAELGGITSRHFLRRLVCGSH